MGDVDDHRFVRLVIEAAYEVQRLIWMLGISEGTVSLSLHHGDAPPLKLDIRRWADAMPRAGPHLPHLPLPDADGVRLKPRCDAAQLRAKIAASLHNMARHAVFCLAGRPFDLEFGHIDFTIRRAEVRDFVVARRVFLNRLEGFAPLSLTD